MKKILITGNSGYIGSHLSDILLNETTYEIHGLDKNKPKVNLYKFYYQDITHQVWNKFEAYDCVIHLAAEVAVSRSVSNPTLYYTTNIQGTLNVLKNINTKQFIHASTGSAGPMNNPYGISKRAAEDVVKQYCTENNIPFTIFRFYNVTGTRGHAPTNPNSLFWNLIRAKETGTFDLFGSDYNTIDGSAVRDYTHVEEICRAILAGINNPTNQIENLGHGVETTVRQMIDTFKKVNQCEFEVKVRPRRQGDLERSVLDKPSKFMQKLYTMEDLLKV